MRIENCSVDIDKSFTIEIKQRFEVRAVKRGQQGDYEDVVLGFFDNEEQAKGFKEWAERKLSEEEKTQNSATGQVK